MSNKRWTPNDKITLMKYYSEGKSYDDISKLLDRTPLAIKLRLESIVYDNLAKGKSIDLLTRMLKTDQDTIKQFYYSHKSFKQGRGETVIDVEFPSTSGIVPTMSHNQSLINQSLNNQSLNNQLLNNQPTINKDSKHRIVTNDQVGGKNANININHIEQIQNENRILEEIIKNHRMKRKIRKLYVDGKLDDKATAMYEKIIKN